MERISREQRYQPLFNVLRIGTKEYAVLDKPLAQERASIYLSRALYLMEQESPERYANTINYELLIATDLGSSDAAFLLACRTLDPHVKVPFPPDDAIVFLKLAADRGHAEAAYELGCCYSAVGHFKNTEKVGSSYFSQIDPTERQRLAEHYFHIAVEREHREAIEELIIAYAYGRGYIAKDAEKFTLLCEKLIARGDQSVALGYGAWLAGITVEGEELLSEAIYVACDYERALEFLLLSAEGHDLELAQHALHLFCLILLQSSWDNLPEGHLEQKLQQSIQDGNQLLALYFGWYSIPLYKRSAVPEFLEEYQLTQLSSFVEPNEVKAIAYLEKVVLGSNQHLASIARDILQQVFGNADATVTEIELFVH